MELLALSDVIRIMCSIENLYSRRRKDWFNL